MSVSILFLLLAIALTVWWMVAQRLTEKPWLATGDVLIADGPPRPTRLIGLGLFMAVVTSLFALITSAYFMRMELADWRPAPEPTILWINTGILIGASIAFQQVRRSVVQGTLAALRLALIIAGALSLAFIAGQFLAWQQLAAGGHGVQGSPASAFFHLITGLHALHLAGGLWVWLRTLTRLTGDADIARLRLAIELCTVYWHFLLLIWLAMFALLLAT